MKHCKYLLISTHTIGHFLPCSLALSLYSYDRARFENKTGCFYKVIVSCLAWLSFSIHTTMPYIPSFIGIKGLGMWFWKADAWTKSTTSFVDWKNQSCTRFNTNSRVIIWSKNTTQPSLIMDLHHICSYLHNIKGHTTASYCVSSFITRILHDKPHPGEEYSGICDCLILIFDW